MRYLILICLLASHICVYSQESFVKGFIVKVSGDTARGYLKRDVDQRLAIGVYFQDDLYSKESRFQSPKEITAFAFENGNIYKAITFADPLDNGQQKTEFAKFLVEGDFSLYAVARRENYYYYLKSVSDTGYFLFDDIYNQNGSINEQGNFKSVLNYEARNCPKLQSKLLSIVYHQQDLMKFVTDLNQCMGATNMQVHYKRSRNEAHFVLYAGGMSINQNTTYTVQGQVRLISPGTSKRTSLVTGLYYAHIVKPEYSNVELHNADFITNLVSIPFLFQYNLTERRFQPLLYVGFSFVYKKLINPDLVDPKGFESNYGFALVGGIGFEYFPIKKLAIKADWRYELMGHTPTLGVAYKFN
jgi:hypothetical protein